MILNEQFLYNHARKNGVVTESAAKDVLMHSETDLQMFAAEKGYDIFLSHSYLDKKLVYALVDLFNAAGFSVYVDWLHDKQLDRSTVTAETADLLRKRMKGSKGLAYISTSNIVNSKWCPWELGYFDALKKSRCCILPVLKETASTYKGQEYLGLYPYIDYTKSDKSDKYTFWINDPKNPIKYVSLAGWLNGKEPTIHTKL